MKGFASTCCAAVILLGALAAPASAQNPGTVGAWSAVQNYPVVPVSAGVMPDGKIVAWDQANAAPWFGPVPHNGPAMVLTPGSGAVTRSSNEAPNTLFCSLLTSLPDGRLAVIGGGSDSGGGASSKVQVYDEDSRTFSVIGQMERARWYPGGSIDAQGNPIVAGGTSTGIERIDASTGTGTLLNTSFPAHWYADLIRTPDNRFAIEDVGDLQGGENSSRFMLNGTSLSSSSDTTLLKNRYRGIRTMIGPHKMLWSSGGTSRESMIIDASGGTPTYSAAASSAFPHMTGQGVTLPTGDVLAVGGNSSGSSSIGTPVMTPELYKPASNTWSSMANMSRQRQYHSVAALLPDGRVWSAGTSWEGTQEANGQYFSPPYLYTSSGQPASRPTATDAPSSVKAGDSFSIATSNPSQIRSASIVRLASTTHQLNAGQAYVPLSTSVSPNGGRVQMTAPTGVQAPPGYYMVFLIDSNGVPSVAPIVRLRSGDSTALPVRAVQSSQLDRNWPASEAFDDNSGSTGGPSGSVSQTQSQTEPWWEVDLGEKRSIGSVTIQLRSDAGTNRDVWVYASDNPITSTTISGARAQSGVTSVRMQTPTGSVNTVQLNRTARYLRVQAPGTAALSLAEVAPNFIPDTPSPTATAASSTQINLSWADVVGETAYRLERSTSSSFTSPIGVDLPSGTTTHAATGLTPATTYYFRLRAMNGAVVSAWSSTVSAATPPDGPGTAPGLVAAYGFEGDGGSSISDVSGEDNHGTLSGSASLATSGGNTTLTFGSAGSGMATIPDSPSLRLTGPMTLEASIKVTNNADWQTVLMKELAGGQSYVLYAAAPPYDGKGSGGEPVGFVNLNGIRGPAPLPTASFAHLAMTYDGSVQRLYVNGSLVASSPRTGGVTTDSGPLTLGRNKVWGEAFKGQLDDVRIYNRALTAAEVVTDSVTPVAGDGTPPPPPPPPPPPGPAPVAAYGFEETSGSLTVDSSPYGSLAQISGATRIAAGKNGRALDFDGDQDRVIAPDASQLRINGSMTLSAWVKPDSTTGWRTVLLKEVSGSHSYSLYGAADPYDGGNAGDPMGFMHQTGLRGPGRLPTGQWSHLAMTYDGGVQRLYLNGAQVSSRTGAPATRPYDSGPLTIGGNGIWGEWFDGSIDEVRVFNQALSASEIANQVSTAEAQVRLEGDAGFVRQEPQETTAPETTAPGTTAPQTTTPQTAEPTPTGVKPRPTCKGKKNRCKRKR